MKKICKNYPLKDLHSFGVDIKADSYIKFENEEEIRQFLANNNLHGKEFLILGEGSNILFTSDYEGLVLHPVIKGIELINEDKDSVELKVGCGENWDNFVEFCAENGYSGIENLSLIPGTVGSAPVQNIGAYGVEVKDCISLVEGIYTESNQRGKLNAEECKFSYRQSIFKQQLHKKFIITHVTFRLSKLPGFILDYGNVKELFQKKDRQDILRLRETIIEIRESKLPDPKMYGNAGSFFKNPVIEKEKFTELQKSYPGISFYPVGEMVKIPAAWLIEKAGWKAYREKDCGTWPTQPLVIVNYGNASGSDIRNLAEKIRTDIRNKFDIILEPEVNII